MRKSTKLVKRFLALFLFVLISVDSFAAIVGDNDGGAFVTKADFEALKDDFNKQIDRYNNSLDRKIDGKIATYLAGINIAKKKYMKSSLEAAGQTYQGIARKSYVFCGNNSVYFMRRYNVDSNQFVKNYSPSFDNLPPLGFHYKVDLTTNSYYSGSELTKSEWWGADQARIRLYYAQKMYDDDGNVINRNDATIFVVDDDNYVTTFKVDAALYGRCYRIAQRQEGHQYINARPFYADATHKWLITFKDVVGASGTNGMGYSTRSLGDGTAANLDLYVYRLGADTTNSRSGYTYMNKTIQDRNNLHTFYIMNYGSDRNPYQMRASDFGSYSLFGEWFDSHLHFEESKFGESYAWCMPFGHLLPDRKAACFRQWPAWENVVWSSFDTQNIKTISDAGSEFSDVSGSHHWTQQIDVSHVYYHNGISRTYFDSNVKDIREFIEITGMLPVWKENPLKDWRLLKNRNIKNALSVEAYYAAAPPLTEEFEEPGSITWVAKINQQDVQRIPGWNFSNWGTNRIYFTSKPMDDIEYSGVDVKVSNTKKFQYKKHDTTDAWADCQSQVLDGQTYYYQTLEHDTYYDFKMDVDAKETTYYMIFDEARPDDYCLEVIEHPDYQIEFTGD